MNNNLEFRKIPSLQFLYEVNSNGTILRNVKSKKHLKIFLDFHHSKKGYWMSFVNIKGKIKRVPIARVVAECWLGPKPEGFEIDHINRDSTQNDYRNLRYVTKSVQMKNRNHTNIAKKGTENVMRHVATIKIPIILTNDAGNSQTFESMTHCASWLAEKYGKKTEFIRKKLKARRKKIYEYNVKYLPRNAETGHACLTGLGTVH